MPIGFVQSGVIQGSASNNTIINNPTSLQFGPDGRLYVSEQNGSINAITVAQDENGQYFAAEIETLVDGNGNELVKNIQCHNDDGSEYTTANRQVTGVLVTGTAEEPVIYIASSDPRIANNAELFLDTNSSVISRATFDQATGEWEVVDLIRGLPRSEENHSANGMLLSDDGTKLYVMVGANTNNGAPSQFFSYTADYALSGVLLEVDLVALDALPTLVDPQGGKNDTPRQYKYDLPTLDDPNVPNITDGVGEDEFGMDEAGPWGGNDGLNMAILPADAPMRIYAEGFRNAYDIAFTNNGEIFTVDNGGNAGLGNSPNFENGDDDGDGIFFEAISTPAPGGFGEGEPLFHVTEGGFYYFSNAVRSNQNQSWTAYNDSGNPDTTLAVHTVADISARVPDSVLIPDGYLIDPSKYAAAPGVLLSELSEQERNDRLFLVGQGGSRNLPEAGAITILGSSSNGLLTYDSGGTAFNGVLDGKLFVTQFNDNVTLLNINATSDGLDPVPTEGPDGIFGTADDGVQAGGADGVFEVANNSLGIPLANPLDVAMGPNGTIWVAEIGSNRVTVLAPTVNTVPTDLDSDDDGILNVDDAFMRDGTNGGSVVVSPSDFLLWDFDANQDENLPGPGGFGGGLTGVMINGTTDYEEFLQSPSTREAQVIQLDNIKFTTAAGGGTTVVEYVGQGDPTGGTNNGTFLFQTGATLAPNVGEVTFSWSMYNPAKDSEHPITGMFQEIGGYIGTGDQSNYLKIAAVRGAGSISGIEIILENNDTILSSQLLTDPSINVFDAADIPEGAKIILDLIVDVPGATVTPVATYETNEGNKVLTGSAIDLSGTNVLQTLLGDWQVNGLASGVAVGLWSTNNGQLESNAFQAIFDDISIRAAEVDSEDVVLYRVNAGGGQVAATDGGPNWSADTAQNNSPYLLNAGSNNRANSAVSPGATVPGEVPAAVFASERWDKPGGTAMHWGFDVADGTYEVRLYVGNGFAGTNDPGERAFDVSVEGVVPAAFNDIDPSALFGHLVGGLVSTTVQVTDGRLDLQFLHGVENPQINAIEIVATNGNPPNDPIVVSIANGGAMSVNEGAGTAFISLVADRSVPSGQQITVTFEIESGTATPGTNGDYSFSGGGTFGGGTYTASTVITGGSADIQVPINILQDALDEPNETFTFRLLSVGPNAQIGAVSQTTVTIIDDDLPPPDPIVVSIASGGTMNVNEGAGTALISLVADRSVPSGQQVTVTFEIVGGTATPGAGGDYSFSGGSFSGGIYTATAVLTGGSTQVQVPVSILQDALDEPNETFTFRLLSASSNAQIGAVSQTTVTIVDDDLPPPGEDVVLYRVNAGGGQVAATDGGPNWSADTAQNNSPYLLNAGSNNRANSAVSPGATVPGEVPAAVFASERWDKPGGTAMHWGFDVADGTYEVRLYVGNGFAGTNDPGERAFDVSVEGVVPAAFNDIDPSALFGHLVGGLVSTTVQVTDGRLDLQFLHGVENPQINAIEIVATNGNPPNDPIVVSIANGGAMSVNEGAGTAFISLVADRSVPSGQQITVTFEIESGTATPGTNGDYSFSGGGTFGGGTYTASTVITGGSADIQVPINILQDALDEPNETFTFRLLSVGPNAQIGAVSQTTVTIIDDDLPPPDPIVVSIASGGTMNVNEGAGTALISLVADRSVPSGQQVTVTFEIVGGTATPGAGGDYSFSGGSFSGGIYTATAVLTGGSTQVQVPVSILQDALDEPNETFTFRLLSASSNAQIGAVSQTTVTIVDDDLPPPGEDVVLYRVNAGGGQVAATDGGPNWSADTAQNNSPYLLNAGSNNRANSAVSPGATVPGEVPAAVFASERWDKPGGTAMHWGFDVADGTYEVRLYVGNGFAGTNDPGERAFDVSVEGVVPAAFNDIDPSALFGHLVGGLVSTTVQVTDGRLDLQFLHGVENPQINAIEIVATNGNPPPDPAEPTTPEEVFALLGETVDNNGAYAPTARGAGVLTIMDGINNIQSSNFTPDSFQLTNTGDKQIAALVIDFRTAVFQDAVIDPDGRGGDPAVKNFAINTAGGTGAFISLSDTYLFSGGPGDIPIVIANSTTPALNGLTSNGGYKGLLVKFDGASGGFVNGETVGFSGDMDPNSIAGLNKTGPLGVDSSGWDSGGVSGSELIGSSFTLLFDDGTTATGYIGSDGSFSGGIGEAVEGRSGATPVVSVETAPGVLLSSTGTNTGTYGASDPVISISGPASATVRVVLQKGVNTVNNLEAPQNVLNAGATSIFDLVQDRLELGKPAFPANNIFDLQFVDVVLDASGEATVGGDAFDFVDTLSGVSFDGDDMQPIAITASIITPVTDNTPDVLLADQNVSLGPISDPIYLVSEFATGSPIDAFDFL